MELPLVLRVYLLLYPLAVLVVCIATIFLYRRTRTRPTLAMMVAVLLGVIGFAVGALSPTELIDEAPDMVGPVPDSSPEEVGTVYARNVWETPAYILMLSGLVLWVGGFVTHSLSGGRRQ